MSNKIFPLISVYNPEEPLHQCLDKASHPTMLEIEFFFIDDDSSTDRSSDPLKECRQQDFHLAVFFNEASGGDALCYFLFFQATGDDRISTSWCNRAYLKWEAFLENLLNNDGIQPLYYNRHPWGATFLENQSPFPTYAAWHGITFLVNRFRNHGRPQNSEYGTSR